jgi:hypothetical protein
LVKLTSYKYKFALLRGRKQLHKEDASRMFSHLSWPRLTDTRAAGRGHRVFINDDLTKQRAEIAAKARQMKRNKHIEDTWVRDGVIIAKLDGLTYRITSDRELTNLSLRVINMKK